MARAGRYFRYGRLFWIGGIRDWNMTRRIVIGGGGFAGVHAAMHFDKMLAHRSDIDVVLISRENFILFTPMLHEVAAGDLYPGDIIPPLRRILRRVNVVEGEVQSIDLSARRVSCVAGVGSVRREFAFDHLLVALGSETNFFNLTNVRDWALTMKNLSDAAVLRNRIVALLEEAALESDESIRRQLLTFVIAGGGFAGVETTGAVNDFVLDTAKLYPSLSRAEIRVVVVHPEGFLLPELGEELGRYAERKLRERKVEVIKGARVASYDGTVVRLSDGNSIPSSTLIWTAGVKPNAVIATLPFEKEQGRLRVDEYLSVAGVSGVWAAGDCAAVPDGNKGTFHPPTAQHRSREGLAAAQNTERAILGRPLEPFRYRTLGLLATIGHRSAVAMIFGLKFSGLTAWWLWRTIYLAKLPGLLKKLRVTMSWTLDLFFGRDIEQIITLRDVEALSDRLALTQRNRLSLDGR